MAPRATVRRVTDAAMIALFLLGIWLPLLGVRIGSHGWDIVQRRENRQLVLLPHLLREPDLTPRAKVKAILKFPGEFKYYLSDHFGFRSLLIKMHGTLMVRGLGVTSNPDVVLGKEGWLYLGNDGSVEDYRRTDPFTADDMHQWQQMLEDRQEFCAKRHIAYQFVVAPSKHDIYPEFMPDHLTRVGGECRMDQLMGYLKEHHCTVPILDLRKPLLDARGHGVRLFHKTDTHWNDRGGWIVYQSIMKALEGRVNPPPHVLPATDFEPVTSIDPGMDLSGLLGLNDVYSEECLNLRPRISMRLPKVIQDVVDPITIEGPDGNDRPRVVVFRDSFLTNVLPWIAQSFGHGVYFWEDGFDKNVVQSEHPDVVIQEIAERKFSRIPEVLTRVVPVTKASGKWELVGEESGSK